MQYIIFDLEFNQDPSDKNMSRYFFEIIQIGAVKLDSHLNSLDEFNRFIRPTVYKKINPFITELTGITSEQLMSEKRFPEVYEAFADFIGDDDSVFCIWGMADIKELFRNADYFKLNQQLIPRMFINLQPYASKYLGYHSKKQLQLKSTVEAMDIPKIYDFHDALHDAYYTAEILKKLDPASIEPRFYDPNYVIARPRQRRREIDFDGLIKQFEKMYSRAMTEEEQKMLILAYKMGRTGQFVK